MQQNEKEASVSGIFVLATVLFNAIVLKQGFITNSTWYAMLPFTLLMLLASIFYFKRK